MFATLESAAARALDRLRQALGRSQGLAQRLPDGGRVQSDRTQGLAIAAAGTGEHAFGHRFHCQRPPLVQGACDVDEATPRVTGGR